MANPEKLMAGLCAQRGGQVLNSSKYFVLAFGFFPAQSGCDSANLHLKTVRTGNDLTMSRTNCCYRLSRHVR